MFSFLGNHQTVSKSACAILHPPAVNQGFRCSAPLSAFGVLSSGLGPSQQVCDGVSLLF